MSITRSIFAVVALLLLISCENTAVSPAAPNEGLAGGDDILYVSAAASLTGAFQAMGARFHENDSQGELVFNFGGSQHLARQIAAGAPAHIFASADLAQMQVTIASGRISENAVHAFATNQLVIVYPAANPARISSLHDLARPGVRLVLPAEQVPAGRYTLSFLDKASATDLGPQYRQQVLGNVASYELNVRAVLTRVSLGEADAGIVYTSDLRAAGDEQPGQLPIPDELNVVAHYYLAPLVSAEENPLARQFLNFVLSAEGQAILESYGFMAIDEAPEQ